MRKFFLLGHSDACVSQANTFPGPEVLALFRRVMPFEGQSQAILIQQAFLDVKEMLVDL